MRTIRRFPLLVLLCFLSFLQTAPPIARAETGPSGEAVPWQLQADRTVSDQNSDILEAFGQVELHRGEDYLQADYVRYYPDTKWVFLRGNVRARFEGDFISAEEAEFNLETSQGWLKNGQVFLEQPHVYFTGERLNKTGKHTYSFTRATVTACDGEVPAWSLQTEEGELTVDGYATLRSPRFRIKDHPVLYSPYLVIPVKTKRQSGFLRPEASVSDRLGFQFNLPYYQVIDEERDVTLYENFISEKGLMQGVEYRSTPNLSTRGLWRLDWLHDGETARTEADEDSQFRGDSVVRKNAERFWLRSKYNGFLGTPAWKTKVDLDLVSDKNYLREFGDGYSGFDESRKEFLKEFGRDIEDDDDFYRTSTLSLARDWANIGFEGRVVYIQNLNYFNDNHLTRTYSDDTSIQRLPELNLNFYKTSLAGTMLDWEATNEAVYFWRLSGTKGTRLDLHPRISLPLRTRFGTVIPKAGWRETLYFVDQYEESASSSVDTDSTFHHRGLPDFNVTAFNELYRIFTLAPSLEPAGAAFDESRWTRLKHSIRPRIEYDFIPYEQQEELPLFVESEDRIDPENNLTYSLTQVLTRKRETVVGDASGEETGDVRTDYLDVVRLRLEQSYDFREASRNDEQDAFPRRPFSDITAELQTSFSRYLHLTDKTWFSPYSGTVTEHEHLLTLTFPEKGNLYFGLDFQKENPVDEYEEKTNFIDRDEDITIVKVGGQYRLNRNWLASFVYRTDLETNVDLEKSLNLRYMHQCFWIDLEASFKDTETRVGVKVNLAQLGSF